MDILDNKYREIFLAEEAKQVMSVILSIFSCVSNSRSHSHFSLTDRMSHTSLSKPHCLSITNLYIWPFKPFKNHSFAIKAFRSCYLRFKACCSKKVPPSLGIKKSITVLLLYLSLTMDQIKSGHPRPYWHYSPAFVSNPSFHVNSDCKFNIKSLILTGSI